MKSLRLQLPGAFRQEGARGIVRTLQSDKCVHKLTVTTAAGIVEVDFDDYVTSTGELWAASQNARLHVKERRAEKKVSAAEVAAVE
jgi:hypothetical protein